MTSGSCTSKQSYCAYLQSLLVLLVLLHVGAARTSTTRHAGSSHWSAKRVFTCGDIGI